MEKEFIPYEQALALKELGFDEECLLLIQHSGDSDYFTREPYRSNDWLNGEEIDFKYNFPKYGKNREQVKIPLYQQAFRWFREKHKAYPVFSSPVEGVVKCHIPNLGYADYPKYEEAELECLKKLIEIAQKSL